MKLAAHYNRASIIISVSVLLASAVVYYLVINHIARQQLDNDLVEELEEVITYVNQNHHLPRSVDFDEDVTIFTKTNEESFATVFFDTPYHNSKEIKSEEGRAIAGLVKANGQNYIVTIVESREETEYLIQIITGVTLILTAVLLGVLIVTNRFVLNGLWRPFYSIVEQVKWFDVADKHKVVPVEARADEFKDLSDAIVKMSARVSGEYQGLKAFTENASHEMMTPLAIITSKLDMLIQDETLNPGQFNQISDIYSAASRLSRLNQSLLLLMKIDNNLLKDAEKVSLRTVILEKAHQFNEMMQNKNIELEYKLDDLEVKASKYLMEVLISNLFSNAIRHNKNPGKILITLLGNKLSVKNTGDAPELDRETVFERFYKGRNSEGTGLGLAIMKNICTLYSCEIGYALNEGMHCFSISFNQP